MKQPGNEPGDNEPCHHEPGNNERGHAATEVIPAVGLCAGVGSGRLLKLDEPLSLWGGTDLHTGMITDVHHPQHGTAITGRVLLMSASRGSSSSSSVLAEQIRAGVGPAALVLCARDAILALGSLAAAELYGIRMPVVLIDPSVAQLLPDDSPVTVTAGSAADGTVGASIVINSASASTPTNSVGASAAVVNGGRS